jgi:Xaa-Pro aminopeptidase
VPLFRKDLTYFPISKISFILQKTNIEEGASPVVVAKSIKNSVELDGFRNCHIRDAVALVRVLVFFFFLLALSEIFIPYLVWRRIFS